MLVALATIEGLAVSSLAGHCAVPYIQEATPSPK